MKSKQKVVVRLLGDRVVKGHLVHFIPEQESFRILTLSDSGATGEISEISFSDVKAVFFVRTFEGDPTYEKPADERSFVPPPQSAYRLEVVFKDGETIRGTAESYSPGSKGFFFSPLDPRDNNLQIYVPRSSIEDVTYRRLLGNILVRQKSISQTQLEKAATIQKDRRDRLIGRILVDENIIDDKELLESLALQKQSENRKLGEILIEQSLITREQLEAALEKQTDSRETRLGEILISMGIITRRQVYAALANQYKTVLVDLAYVSVDPDVLARVSAETAHRFRVVPVGRRGKFLHIATLDPGNQFVHDYLQFESRMKVKFVVALPADMKRALSRFYSAP
jgi:hypothetical protein